MDDWMDRFRDAIGDRGPTIRVMISADVEEVLRIIRLHDSDDYKAAKQVFDHHDFNQAAKRGRHVVLVEPTEGRLVGVSGHFIDDLEAKGIYWLGWTYVNPYFRGKGYGSMLLPHVVDEVRSYGARKLYLSTSGLPSYARAVRFYERNGFKAEGHLIDYYGPGDDKLIYGLTL